MAFLDNLLIWLLLLCQLVNGLGKEPLWKTVIPENFPDSLTLKLNDGCSADLDADWCTLDVDVKAVDCLVLGGMLSKLDEKIKAIDIMEKVNSAVGPDDVGIDIAYINYCSQTLFLSSFLDDDITLVDDYLTLSKPEIRLSLNLPLHQFNAQLDGVLKVGQLAFQVQVLKTNNALEMSGKLNGNVSISVNKFLSEIVSTLLPNKADIVEEVLNKIGFLNIDIEKLEIKAKFADGGMAFEFKCSVLISGEIIDFQTLLSKEFWGINQDLGAALSAQFGNVKLADIIKKITSIDISKIPVVGNLELGDLPLIVSSKNMPYPLLPILLEKYPFIKSVDQGVSLIFSADVSGATFSCQVTLSKEKVAFELLPGSYLPVTALLSKININLPKGFNIDDFFSQALKSFKYLSNTKELSVDIDFPDDIKIMKRLMTLKESRLEITVDWSSGQGDMTEFNLETLWQIKDFSVRLNIQQVQENLFRAEGYADVDIPIGKLAENFAASLLPKGPIRDAVKKSKLDLVVLKDPAVILYFGDDIIANIIGSVDLEDWSTVTFELIVGTPNDKVAIATGILFDRTPVLKVIKKITNIDLTGFPGASFLDNTDVALVFSPNDIPAGSHFGFSTPLLSEIDIKDGLGIIAKFSFPENCENFCKVMKKLVGEDLEFILKTYLSFDGIRLDVVLPIEIPLYKDTVITDVGFMLAYEDKSFALGVTGTIVLASPTSLFQTPIYLTATIGVRTEGVFVEIVMKGLWKKVFGIPFLSIGNVHFMVAVSPAQLPLTALEFGGEAMIGMVDKPGIETINITLYVGINRQIPEKSYFMGSISKLTLASTVKAFTTSFKLPKALDEIGFPEGVNCSFAMEERTLPNGIVIPRGFYFRGMMSILSFKLWTELRVTDSDFFANITAAPFSFAKGLISMEGLIPGTGPGIVVKVGWKPFVAEIKIQGKIKLLFFTTATNITIDNNGAYFKVTGKILNLFEAELEVKAAYTSIKSLEFEVAGMFKSNLMKKLMELVEDAFDAIAEIAKKAIKWVKDKIEDAVEQIKEWAKKVENAVKKVAQAIKDVARWVDNVMHITETVKKLKKGVEKAIKLFTNSKYALEKAKQAVKKIRHALKRVRDKVKQKIKEFANAVKDVLKKLGSLNYWKTQLKKYGKKLEEIAKTCLRYTGCPDKRSVDLFLPAENAKAMLKTGKSLARRGWLSKSWKRIKNWFESRREEIAERGEEFRESAENRREEASCFARWVINNPCFNPFKALEKLVSSIKSSLSKAQSDADAATMRKAAKEQEMRDAIEEVNSTGHALDQSIDNVISTRQAKFDAANRMRAAKTDLAVATRTQSFTIKEESKAERKQSAAEAEEAQARNALRKAEEMRVNQLQKLEEVKKANSLGVKILTLRNSTLVQRGVERSLTKLIIDIQEIGFRCKLSVLNSGYFEVSIKVRWFLSVTDKYHLKINLRSLSSIVKSLVDKAKSVF